jgi:isopentenyl-diphosphate delta-isomerase type 1
MTISLPRELVVLLDSRGRPAGTQDKARVHTSSTPLHLAFSCHVVDATGRVLLTRRAATKRTFPALWTNACCGHPAPGESLREAVTRRLAEELGLRPRRLGLALPDFAYRSVMADGTVEHELCPVVVAEVVDPDALAPDAAEVDGMAWMSWDALIDRARDEPETLSPWSVAQVGRLAGLAASPLDWLDRVAPSVASSGLDGPAASAAVPPSVDVLAMAKDRIDALAMVKGRVDEVLAKFMVDREEAVAGLGPEVTQLSREVRRLVEAGGKRLRPAFVYWGHRATGADHDDAVFTIAAAVELLHTFALIHDDVMDRSQQRRGRPAAQQALADLHADDRLSGDGPWFGVSGALLAGDLAFVWADEMLESAPLPDAVMASARKVFTQLRTEVIGGQYLDLRQAHQPLAPAGVGLGLDDAEVAALRVALLKSARYTVTRPLELGASLVGDGGASDGSGSSSGLGEVLSRYGDAVGLAFQLRDDVLGLFGDPEVTGKSCLDDLREGKRTLLVLRALRLAPEPDRRLLAAALGNPDLDRSTARRCCEIVASSGARASVEALIDHQHAVALHAIAGLSDPARSALTTLAALSTHRDR